MSDELKNETDRNGTDGFEAVLENFAWMFIDPLFKEESIVRELGVSLAIIFSISASSFHLLANRRRILETTAK